MTKFFETAGRATSSQCARMRACFALLLATAALLHAQTSIPDGGFEENDPGSLTAPWTTVLPAGFHAAVTDAGCIEGSRCAVLSGDSAVAPGTIGVLRTTLPGPDFAARRVRYRAAVRVEEGASARLWLRVDRADGSIASLENMAGQPIRSTEWAYYTIDARISLDAAKVIVGVFLSTPGRAWFDDATTAIAGELLSEPIEEPRPLSDMGLENIVAFAKLAGYVRYFHPSDQASQVDWETFLIQGARQVEDAASPQELASRLQAMFDPIAPTVRVFPEGEDPPTPPELIAQSDRPNTATRWFHEGLGLGTQSRAYRSSRELTTFFGNQFRADYGDPAQAYEALLARGVGVRVPTTLLVAGGRTLPLGDPADPAGDWTRAAEDRATRLAGVIIAWNVLQHFYPYMDITDVDMPAELRRALRAAAEDATRAEFLSTMRKLLAAIQDGHGDVVNRGELVSQVPLIWRWIEGQAIVVRIKDAQGQPVQAGDRVLSVDGITMDEALAREETEISSATPQWKRYRALQELAECDQSRRMTVEIEPYGAQGESRTLAFDCIFNSDWTEPRPETVAELEPGIVYLNIDRLTEDRFRAALPRLQAASGIVFDMRGYPEFYPPTWVQHLTEVPAQSELFLRPTPRLPDQVGLTFDRSSFTLEPLQPLLRAKSVFLTDASVLSQPETDLDWIEHYKLGEVVGEPTGGTTGNVNPFDIPGGFGVRWTGMQVLKQDGSRFHGVGIRPTIPASRTRQGVAEGRDELLEAGIEAAKGPKLGPAPAISAAGIVNAASFVGGPVAPGEMVTIFGTGLGPAELAFSQFDFSGYLWSYAGETRVFFDGAQAPLVHASGTQVTVLVPYGVAAETRVQVDYQGRPSNEVRVPVARAAPGLFAYGATQAAAVNQDNSFNSETNPAKRGEILTLFATGEGGTTPASLDGRLPPPGKWPVPEGEVVVAFSGLPGEIVFQGVRTGVLQINVRVPEAAPAGGAVPVVLSVGGIQAAGERTVALE